MTISFIKCVCKFQTGFNAKQPSHQMNSEAIVQVKAIYLIYKKMVQAMHLALNHISAENCYGCKD